jgi:acyl carrier protein
VMGAWRLHEATRDLPLDFFVCVSSLAGVTGSAGQSAYASANAFLDGLARFRRAQGLPAVSVDWAPWEDSAVVKSLSEAQQRHLRCEVEFLDAARATTIFSSLLDGPAQVAVFQPGDAFPRSRPFLSQVASILPAGSKTPAVQLDIESLRSRSGAERLKGIRQFVSRLAASVLDGESNRDIPFEQPFQELGMDSMMTIELIQSLGSAIGHTMPPTLPFNYPTVDALGAYVDKLLFADEKLDPWVEKIDHQQASEAEVLRLSEAELEALVNEEFTQLLSRAATPWSGTA